MVKRPEETEKAASMHTELGVLYTCVNIIHTGLTHTRTQLYGLSCHCSSFLKVSLINSLFKTSRGLLMTPSLSLPTLSY